VNASEGNSSLCSGGHLALLDADGADASVPGLPVWVTNGKARVEQIRSAILQSTDIDRARGDHADGPTHLRIKLDRQFRQSRHRPAALGLAPAVCTSSRRYFPSLPAIRGVQQIVDVLD
jgi:hypothetical protein